MKKIEEYLGVGRRKTAIASVRLRPGVGKVDVNKQEIEKYFSAPLQRDTLLAPLKELGLLTKYDVILRLSGGGIESQAVASRLGVARALVTLSEQYRARLKELGYLTRDSRKKERKKYGQKGARKKFQFSKR
jgi:small subunit ribosomal protein S9